MIFVLKIISILFFLNSTWIIICILIWKLCLIREKIILLWRE